MTEFQIEYDNSTIEDALFDVEVVTNANPFGDHGTAFIQDRDGNKFDTYSRGTRVDFRAREFGSGNSFSDILNGYVVERRESNKFGAEVLEVECYSLDTLLRRNTVDTDISGQSMLSALEEIIKDWTPVTWNSSNVTIVQSQEITRPFENEKVDNILNIFSRKSGNEEFGVNKSLEFFFRPGETSYVSRGVGPDQWTNYDIPERAKEAVNEVRVYWDDGNRVFITSDDEDKLELQDSLGASKPVTLSQQTMREDITNPDDAKAVGEEILQDRQPLLTGTVTTFGLLDAEPGDTIDIEIPTRGLREEFRIAQIEYRWGNDETILTVVEEPQDQRKEESERDDMLVRMSDVLERVEMRVASQSGDIDENVRQLGPLEIGGLVNWAGSVENQNYDIRTLTNDGFSTFVEAWRDEATITVSNILLGTGGSDPTRTDTSMGSQSESLSASISTSGGNVVEFTASPTTGDDIIEIGLEDSGGTLLGRATLNEAVTSPDDVTVQLEFRNNTADRFENSVLTDTGQTCARDIWADNSPTYSSKYAVGDGTTDVAESDTSLGNQLDSSSLGAKIIAKANSDDTFDSILEVSETDPLRIQNSNVELTQTAFTVDAAADANVYNSSTTSDSSYNDGTAVDFTASAGNVLRFSFTTDHTIPAGNLSFAVRAEVTDVYIVEAIVYPNDGPYDSVQFSPTSSLDWTAFAFDEGLDPGTHTFELRGELERGSTAQNMTFDVLTVFDNRYHTASNFDNTLDANGGYLDSPANGPTSAIVANFDDANLQTEKTEATISSTWNDVSGAQYLQIRGNQDNNTQTTTQTFTSSTFVAHQAGLNAYGSRSGETPLQNHLLQKIQDYTLLAGSGGITKASNRSLEFESTIEPNDIDGETIKEAGLLDSSDTTQTRHRVADFTVESDQEVRLLERHLWRMTEGSRPVNSSDFVPTITNTEVVNSGDITNQAYYLVKINSIGIQE